MAVLTPEESVELELRARRLTAHSVDQWGVDGSVWRSEQLFVATDSANAHIEIMQNSTWEIAYSDITYFRSSDLAIEALRMMRDLMLLDDLARV